MIPDNATPEQLRAELEQLGPGGPSISGAFWHPGDAERALLELRAPWLFPDRVRWPSSWTFDRLVAPRTTALLDQLASIRWRLRRRS